MAAPPALDRLTTIVRAARPGVMPGRARAVRARSWPAALLLAASISVAAPTATAAQPPLDAAPDVLATSTACPQRTSPGHCVTPCPGGPYPTPDVAYAQALAQSLATPFAADTWQTDAPRAATDFTRAYYYTRPHYVSVAEGDGELLLVSAAPEKDHPYHYMPYLIWPSGDGVAFQALGEGVDIHAWPAQPRQRMRLACRDGDLELGLIPELVGGRSMTSYFLQRLDGGCWHEVWSSFSAMDAGLWGASSPGQISFVGPGLDTTSDYEAPCLTT